MDMDSRARMTNEERLAALRIELPTSPKPVARFTNAKRIGLTLYLSGQIPRSRDGAPITGLVGDNVSCAQAYDHARLAGLALLAVARDALGSLDEVAGVTKLFGMVRATPDFADHPAVIDGCSDLFADVFGEAGIHARSAVGMGSLPMQATLEIEAIFELRAHI